MQEGDKVYYTENGEKDTGVIVAVLGKGWFTVVWDDGTGIDSYLARQLTHIYSPAPADSHSYSYANF